MDKIFSFAGCEDPESAGFSSLDDPEAGGRFASLSDKQEKPEKEIKTDVEANE